MKQVSRLVGVKLRQMIAVVLVALLVVFSNAISVQAEPITPEATSYQAEGVDPRTIAKEEKVRENLEKSEKLLEEEGYKSATKTAAEKAQDNNKGFFENIKDKLNLDEPIDPGTKQAAEQLKEAVTGE